MTGSRAFRPTFGTGLVLTLVAGRLLFGQATGSMSGTVTDMTGAGVPGATVTVTAPATGVTRSSKTNEGGEYIIPLLGVANYNVQVEQSGFQNATAQVRKLNEGKFDIRLDENFTTKDNFFARFSYDQATS